MNKARLSEEQIIAELREQEGGMNTKADSSSNWRSFRERVTPAEAEDRYYAAADNIDMAA